MWGLLISLVALALAVTDEHERWLTDDGHSDKLVSVPGYRQDEHMRRLVDGDPEPLMLEGPADAQAAVLLIPAPGESRSGNNFLLSQIARACAASRLLTARFDLSGQGDSLGSMNVDVWLHQVAQSHEVLGALVPGPVHAVAHAAASALLEPVGGHTIALCPPTASELDRLADYDDGTGNVVGSRDPSGDEQQLWAALGAEPALAPGLELPVQCLRHLARLIATEPWDTVAVPATEAPARGSCLVVAEKDRLLRLEVIRLGASALLARHLEAIRAKR